MNKKSILASFNYKRKSGELFWKKTRSRKKLIGKIAGCINNDGYILIGINNKRYYAHHIIWFIENNEIAKEIDHINGIRNDNRITNLRSISRRDNLNNKIMNRDGRMPGCYLNKENNKWLSQIYYNKKRLHIGYFKTEKEAHIAYMKKRELLGV